MRVLVTGAAGLIGGAVAARLAKEHDVIGLDVKPGAQVSIVGDCYEVAEWRRHLGDLDAIVHTAALHVPHVGIRSDADFRQTNVEATSRLLDLALDAGAGHFVLTSTTSLYGHALDPDGTAVWVDERLEPQPRDIYDETKLEAEQLVASAGSSLTATSLRMSRCFPEPAEVMAWYRLFRGIDRRDVAQGHLLALERSGPPATYVISSASPFHPHDCERLLANAVDVIDQRCPGLIDRMAVKGWQAPQSIGRVYDCSLAAQELGFVSRFGIEACLADDWDPMPTP